MCWPHFSDGPSRVQRSSSWCSKTRKGEANKRGTVWPSTAKTANGKTKETLYLNIFLNTVVALLYLVVEAIFVCSTGRLKHVFA